MNNFYKVLLLCFIYMFSGCSAFIEPEPKLNKEEPLPKWVNTIDMFYAVGSSPVNFQGLYTQHLEAMNKAKSVLAHNLTSYIISITEQTSKTNQNSISRSSYRDSIALSKVLLNQSYQVDAFFHSNGRLYVLVKSSKEKIVTLLDKEYLTAQEIELPILNTRPFKQEELMQSRCYSKDILKTINTTSDLYQNRPIWFFRPNQNGVAGAVGIAEKEEGISFEKQKEIALTLAKSSLAKNQSTNIISEQKLLNISRTNVFGKLFETSSIVKTSTLVNEYMVSDIWLDPNSCELYIWITVK